MHRAFTLFSAFFIVSEVFASLSPAQCENIRVAQAAAETGLVHAENITIATPQFNFKIKSVELSGTALTNADLAAILDEKSQQPLADRLRQISANSITIPEIIVQHNNDPHETTTYRRIHLEALASGVAVKASVAETDFHKSSPPDQNISGAFGLTSVETIDLGLIAELLTDAGQDAARPKQPLYDTLAIEGLTLAEPQSELAVSAKRLTARAIKARPLAFTLPPRFPNANDKAAIKQFSGIFSQILDAEDVGDLQLEGLKIDTSSKDGPIVATAERFQIHDFKDGRVALVGFHDLDIKTKQVITRLDNLVLRNLDLKSISKALAQQAASDEHNGQEEADKDSGARPLVTAPTAMLIDGLSVTILNPGKSNPPAEPLVLTIAHLETQNIEPDPGKSLQFATSVDHLAFQAQPDASTFFKTLAALGYGKVDLSAHVAMSFSSLNELSISDLTLSGVDMGKFKSSLRADNVSHDILSQDRAASETAFRAALFKRLELNLDNEGLFEKILNRQAEDQHKTVEDMRDTYVTAAGMIVPVLLGNGPSSKEIGAALAKFIAKPKGFHLVLDAPLGVTAADLSLLQEPASLLKKINVEVSATP